MTGPRVFMLLAALSLLPGCWEQFEDFVDPIADDDDSSAGDDDDSVSDDDDSVGDDDDAAGDDDDSVSDDDDSVGDDDDATEIQDDDDTPVGDDDDSSVGDDDDSSVGDDDDSSVGDDDDSSVGDDDDSALGDDDDSALGDDDDSALGDDDDSVSVPCGVTPVTMDVEVELLDPWGGPTNSLSTSQPLTIAVTLQNLGTTPETQWYGSTCLYQHFLWDAQGNSVAAPRGCTNQFQQWTFSCTDTPAMDTDPLYAFWTGFDGMPTNNPLPVGTYTLEVDTYYYGVFSFSVDVVP